jgi:uncharacterized protein DUF6446
MNGKLLVSAIVLIAAVGGASMYYFQVYAYYQNVEPVPGQDVKLISSVTNNAEAIEYNDFQAIDATSSPIRYRACFTTTLTPAQASESYLSADHDEPRNAPGWFGCFDAEAIGTALAQGRAKAFLSAKNISYGVDRVVAITEDGHGYVWHELNQCGKKAYDGTVVGEECPPLNGQDGNN